MTTSAIKTSFLMMLRIMTAKLTGISMSITRRRIRISLIAIWITLIWTMITMITRITRCVIRARPIICASPKPVENPIPRPNFDFNLVGVGKWLVVLFNITELQLIL
uniref:Uncharacterized protein n=1 Tax=Glossina brevipalpis TaxID=37001 RepID=A0A1A9X444_9MUSC